MKKRIARIALLVSVLAGLFYFGGVFESLTNPSTVRAFGDLLVNFHVPVGTPIYSLLNIKPGQSEDRNVDVFNSGAASRFVAVAGVRTGGSVIPPFLDSTIRLTISDGSTILYGPKILSDFFSDSLVDNGIPLGVVNQGDNKTYKLTALFPPESGNEFQGKGVLFDLTFGTITADHLVINEVFYNDDPQHHIRDDRDRDREHDRDEKPEHKNSKSQWIELYNPTDHEISLKGWSITDNSGRIFTIHSNHKIKQQGFAVLAHDDSVWKVWWTGRNIVKIEMGSKFGHIFDSDGDRVILRNGNGVEIDRMSWGTDTTGFSPPGVNPTVPRGYSTSRIAPGYDLDKTTDWVATRPPIPGN